MGLGSTSALGDFYPRPPRGGRLTKSCRRVARPRFLSTPSARRATDTVRAMHRMQNPISIHALREEGDITPISAFARASHFYPRPPRGGRPEKSIVRVARIIFLSTPSARRATNQAQEQRQDTSISIHALREEGDIVRPFYPGGDYEFLSTPSARRATNNPDDGKRTDRFLSTPSARRATSSDTDGCRHLRNFYPRPPRGGRPAVAKSGNALK